MTTETTVARAQRAPGLLGQTVVVIGGSAGIGLETPGRRAPKAPRSSSPAATPSAWSTPRASSAR